MATPLTNQQLIFWAKLGNATWPDTYHPALCHLIDVGQVARQLWDRAIRKRTQKWVSDRLGLAQPNVAGAWLAFWAAAHDIGKLSHGFQIRDERTDKLKWQLQRTGFDLPSGERPHGDISTNVLAAELESAQRGWPVVSQRIARNIAVAIGGHHGIFPSNWDQMGDLLGNERLGDCSP